MEVISGDVRFRTIDRDLDRDLGRIRGRHRH
jgi:hypothetical protein